MAVFSVKEKLEANKCGSASIYHAAIDGRVQPLRLFSFLKFVTRKVETQWLHIIIRLLSLLLI